MRLPIVAAASFVLTVFAGCVGDVSSSEGPASEAPQVNSGAAEFDGETGAVQGTVTDDEIQPIANAQVGILKSDLVPENIAVLTDQSGRFTLSRVPPGTHSIIATALGYETAGSKIEVIAGQVVEKSFIIPKLPTDEALKIVYSVKGSIDRGASWKLTHPCIYEPLTSVNPLLKTCGGIVQGGSNQEIGIGSRKTPTAAGAVEPDWATMMVELVWTQQTAVVGRSLQLDILFPNITRGTNGAANQADPRYFQNPDTVVHVLGEPRLQGTACS
ncbi:MAG: carboxypeptidase regulatory-like domain-containing protein [Euryarchaeota archaeon]|nr:carboxypeptidase regulatory-like domain-containing protein [Euryarchaeota archaeon]